MKKLIVLLLITPLLFSCLKSEYLQEVDGLAVPEKLTVSPDTVALGQKVTVYFAGTQANTCWTMGNIELTPASEIKADESYAVGIGMRARFSSNAESDCKEIIVRKDTTLLYTPQNRGKYYFLANYNYVTVLRDSVYVK